MTDKTGIRDGVKVTGSYIQALKTVFTSISILRENKGLIAYFIVPFLINIIILSSVFYFSYTVLEPWLSGAISGEGWYFDMMRFLISPVIIILLGILTILIYSVLGSIVTAPFNDLLSEGLEKKIGSQPIEEPFSLKNFITDIMRITRNIVKMTVILLTVNIIILALNMIPFVGNLLYTALNLAATSFFLGFQFFDFPLERRRFEFREKLAIMWKFKALTAGVGTGFFLISFIPVVGFLGLNLATMAATILFLEHIQPALGTISPES